MAIQSFGLILDFRQPLRGTIEPSVNDTTPSITSLKRLKPVHYRTLHVLKVNHPQSLLAVNKELYHEFLPKIYGNIIIRKNGLYKLLRGLVKSEHNTVDTKETPIYGSRVIEALERTEQLQIIDLGDNKRLKDVLVLWIRYKSDLIFPNLEHISLGEKAIENALTINEEYTYYKNNTNKWWKEDRDHTIPRPYMGRIELDIMRFMIKLSSVKTICIHWPSDLVQEKDVDDDDRGNILDWYIPELLHNLDSTSIQLEKIIIHFDPDNLGRLVARLLAHKPNWGNHRPKVILDFIDSSPKQSITSMISTAFHRVIGAMDDSMEDAECVDFNLLAEGAISFQIPVNEEDTEAALEEVGEDVLDDYEGVYDMVKLAIRWKRKDNMDDWDCPCGKHIPNWENGISPGQEDEDITQTKIDQYFKPLRKN